MTRGGAFISYSSKDREFVRRLAQDLIKHEIPIWFAEFDLEPGDSLIQKIEDGIDRMEFLLVVLTPASVESRWVKEEVRMALHDGIAGKKFPVIPVLREKCQILGFLREKVYVDMRPEADYGDGLAKLFRKIKPSLEFKSSLQGLKDKLDHAGQALGDASRGVPGDKIKSTAGRVITLIDKVLRGEVAESEWEKAVERTLSQNKKSSAVFNQRGQKVGNQINIGSLNFSIPVFPESIDFETLKEAETQFRERIKGRFEKGSRYYIELTGETTEPDPAIEDESAPRSAERRLQRIKAEYCEWIQHGQGIKRVKLNTLREALDKYPCVILLGDPGCGKTTALERLAYELADDSSRLPLPLRLVEFEPGMSVEDFITSAWSGPVDSGHWNAPEVAKGLTAYLESGKLFFLFDALNQMPQEGYADRLRALRGFINKWSPKGNRFLVTCRVLDYGEELSGLQRVEIQPLDDDKIKAFVQMELPRRWEGLWGELNREKNPQRSLMGLARNPYMLTLMIDVYTVDGRLGRNRSELMQRFTEILMERAKETCPPEKRLDAEIVQESLSVMAFEIQSRVGFGTMVKIHQAESVMPAEVQPDPKWPPVSVPPKKVVDLAASALIIEMTGDRSSLEFYHQLLQEYYAAREMLKREPPTLKAKWRWPWLESEMPKWVRPENNWDPLPPPPQTGWEETTIMASGLRPENDDQFVLAVNAANPVLAGRCLHEGKAEVLPAVRKKVVESLLAAVSSPKIALRVRIAAGDVLGYLGDPRIGELEPVRAGKFKMGEDQDEKASPQRELYLPDYQIGKYPVTNAELGEFVNAGGYEEKSWWTKAGLAERRDSKWSEPRFWDDSRFNQPNYPVVGVSWYECLAYCNWKRATTKLPFRLPSEAEWEKAARGSKDGRRYPWGDNFDPSRLNSSEGDRMVRSTTPVGIYPSGVSPFGCMDMAGNVWEWTSSLWGENWEKPSFKYPYRPDDGRENLDAGNKVRRVLRGGSWNNLQSNARCAIRDWFSPPDWVSNIGFRVVVSPVSPPSAP